jgi:hypothetical protein
MTWSCPSSLLSRPPVPNYIEFTRRQKASKSKKLGTEVYCNHAGHRESRC